MPKRFHTWGLWLLCSNLTPLSPELTCSGSFPPLPPACSSCRHFPVNPLHMTPDLGTPPVLLLRDPAQGGVGEGKEKKPETSGPETSCLEDTRAAPGAPDLHVSRTSRWPRGGVVKTEGCEAQGSRGRFGHRGRRAARASQAGVGFGPRRKGGRAAWGDVVACGAVAVGRGSPGMHANESGLHPTRWRWGLTWLCSLDKHLLRARNAGHAQTGTRCTAGEACSLAGCSGHGNLDRRYGLDPPLVPGEFCFFSRMVVSIRVCVLSDYRAKRRRDKSANVWRAVGKAPSVGWTGPGVVVNGAGMKPEWLKRHRDQQTRASGRAAPSPAASGQGAGACGKGP